MDTDLADGLIELLPRLRRFARSLCRSQEEADDLVQSACERALAAAASWQPGTRLDSWLFRILRNLWIDALRRRRTEGTRVDLDDEHGLAGDDGVRISENRLMLSRVEAAIAELPEEQREVLVLTCMEDFSYRETADCLGIPIGTVMSRLARARKALAGKLEAPSVRPMTME